MSGVGPQTGAPLVSVVMPSYNQASFIEASVRSVLDQDYPAIELIVADGGSSDGTVPCLEGLSLEYPGRLRWTSEKDKGPAHAINKALGKVRGTVIGWLNSDDLYARGAVARAVAAFDSHPDWLMVYGQGCHINEVGDYIDPYLTKRPDTPITDFRHGCFICQPTVFFKRTMFVLLGKMDEDLKTSFDFDYWLRAFTAFPERIGFVEAMQAYSRLHSSCITLSMRRTVAMEGMQVLARYFGNAPGHWLLTYVRELLAGRAVLDTDADLREHLESALQEARAWLAPSELDGLRESMESLLLEYKHEQAVL